MKDNKKLSSVVRVFLIGVLITALFFCQKTETERKKGEYHEYLIDSLRVADRLESLAQRVVKLFGEPHGPGRFTLPEGTPEYEEFQIKIYQDRVALLSFKDEIKEVRMFLDKYREKPEEKFMSREFIFRIMLTMEYADKYQARVQETIYREGYELRSARSSLGYSLGEFIGWVKLLTSPIGRDMWLDTVEDVQRKAEKEKEKLKHFEEERANIMEDLLKAKKQK